MALVALSLTFGLVQLDATIVNVALDSVRADLGGGLAQTQWLVDAYAVPFAALLLAAGALGDRWGHRRTCLTGFAVFALASVPAALAGTWAVLLSARVLQGVGAALMLPASLALVRDLFPEPGARQRALGVWGGIASVGFAAGPVVGGLLISTLGWPAVFWLNVPVAVVVASTIALTGPPDRPRPRRASATSTALGVLALGSVVAAIVQAGQDRLVTAAVLGLVAVAAGAAYVRSERRSTRPLVPAEVRGSRALQGVLATGFGFNFTMYGALLCTSLVLQGREGLSPLEGGLAVLPMAVVVGVGATASGYAAARTGPRAPMLAGLCLGGVGVVLVGLSGPLGSAVLLVVGLATSGLISLAMPAMTSVALDAVAAGDAGLAGGALNAVRQVGGAVGVAVMGALLNAGGGSIGLLAAGAAGVVAVGIAVAGALVGTSREVER
ncbi:MFS transporter [Marmoricola endophyticus]|uniref:MFS transporter n=1 Tax=Marmoricola endophyticus TaxID=2040280 RepID=A0A917F027_9ACTN|nr:MFS transporter [Marmoricola endophyticus]